ncbi:MAG: class C sortase [Clostridiales Family XIII bacterium]|jgi:sortase A|nr:class C sortase [Clostridiales Family XIII bacterium]
MRKRKSIRNLLVIIVAVLGVGLFSYPHVANFLSEIHASYAMQAYADAVSEFSDEEIAAAWTQAEAYNARLSGEPVHDPFTNEVGYAMPEDYFSVLALDDVMGTLSIPKINLNLPIRHGTSALVLKNGAGHLEGSSMPVGGAGCHTVLTGHTGFVNARLFTDLTKLENGDEFSLHVLGRTLTYRVTEIHVVLPSETGYLSRVPGKDLCTLVTCTPYGVNSHRLLVRGERVEETASAEEDSAGSAKKGVKALFTKAFWRQTGVQEVTSAGICGVAAFGCVLLVFIVWRRRHGDEDSEEG